MTESPALADLPELPQDMDDKLGIIQLVKGVANETPFWAYMAMKPSRYKEYYQAVLEGRNLNLKDYGDVLESGWGDDPPAETHARMVEDYGFDDEMETRLQAMIREGWSQDTTHEG